MNADYDTARVSFMSRGTRCAGWLTLPDGPGPHPGLVLAHGLGATHGMLLSQYEQHFAKSAWPLLRLTTGTPASPTASLVSSSACARTARTLRRRVTICVSTTASTLPGWVCGGPAWERYTCCKRRRTASR